VGCGVSARGENPRSGSVSAASASALSFVDRRRVAVLLVADVLAPADDVALVVCLLNRDVNGSRRPRAIIGLAISLFILHNTSMSAAAQWRASVARASRAA
jgi:hypothetical protein